jgi:hypothetical protein
VTLHSGVKGSGLAEIVARFTTHTDWVVFDSYPIRVRFVGPAPRCAVAGDFGC